MFQIILGGKNTAISIMKWKEALFISIKMLHLMSQVRDLTFSFDFRVETELRNFLMLISLTFTSLIVYDK